jgi:hypothetical protein
MKDRLKTRKGDASSELICDKKALRMQATIANRQTNDAKPEQTNKKKLSLIEYIINNI